MLAMSGVRIARAKFICTMAADNIIFPNALRELLDAISRNQNAATYSLLCRFRNTPANRGGLLSCYDWDPQILVQDPYIDAMAMFRRDALLQLGGYDISSARLAGLAGKITTCGCVSGRRIIESVSFRTSFVSTVIIKPRCSTRRTCSKLSWFNISLIVLETCSGGTSHVARCSGCSGQDSCDRLIAGRFAERPCLRKLAGWRRTGFARAAGQVIRGRAIGGIACWAWITCHPSIPTSPRKNGLSCGTGMTKRIRVDASVNAPCRWFRSCMV